MTTRLGPPVRPQLTLRLLGLLVGAVLLGLLGMHGLGPVPAGAHSEMHPAAASTTGADGAADAGDRAGPGQRGVKASASDVCEHGDGGCGGHMAHADSVCASASVAGPPTVAPAMLPDVIACPARPGARASSAGSRPDGGRAPPSLSELQLLRI
ncbi:DUF6153 family protein [Streptomyces sp. AcE210]|uniref:DUF6153 family protein n=1 Tax=Streptomyces sp. AcE210 TaxID=2292703 RepID=UPI001F0BAFB7|nr:DUF6153 family protein [Streptomyces sp. AcE210]